VYAVWKTCASLKAYWRIMYALLEWRRTGSLMTADEIKIALVELTLVATRFTGVIVQAFVEGASQPKTLLYSTQLDLTSISLSVNCLDVETKSKIQPIFLTEIKMNQEQK
jgi:hypothetical protein